MLHELKEQVLEANLRLPSSGLVTLTWGNVSGLDRERGLMVIKPSGVPYAALRMDDLVVMALDGGNVVEGRLRPSSDAPTHLALYRAFSGIGGICHTHSPAATAWSQAGRPLPCYGTTHADHFYGTVPVAPFLTEKEVQRGYEESTGEGIAQLFIREKLDALSMPAVLLHGHAPFTWGKHALDALDNSIALEKCAQMASTMLALDPQTPPLPQYILNKHYLRKHGPGAYYGQKTAH